MFAAASAAAEAPLILQTFAEAGGTLIDTSDNYNRGQSEDFVGALGLELTDDHFDRIDRASAVTLGVPHDGAVANRRRLLGTDPEQFVLSAVPPS